MELIDLGKASSLILGLAALGHDPDGSAFPIVQELEEDAFAAD
jgi:hypothetical protein